MAAVPRDPVDDDMPVYGSSVDIPDEGPVKFSDDPFVDVQQDERSTRAEWYDVLGDSAVWQALEAQAGELLTYNEDHIQLGAGAPIKLGGEVFLTARTLLGNAGWNVVGDHLPPFSLLVTRE